MKKLPIVYLMAISAACTVKLIPPTQSDVDRVSAKYPGYTLTQLSEAKPYMNKHATDVIV
jgi:hypothetical protein